MRLTILEFLPKWNHAVFVLVSGLCFIVNTYCLIINVSVYLDIFKHSKFKKKIRVK